MVDNKNIRILYVDDEPNLLCLQKEVLENEKSFDVTTANSVKEAIQLLDGNSFDIIISDYEMPIMNGLQFLELLRKNENNIPFILFTGKGREEIVIQALNLGADRYIQKGIDSEAMNTELTDAIKKIVNNRRKDIEYTQTLKNASDEWKQTFDSIIDIVSVISKDHTILKVNKTAIDSTGLSETQLIGKKCYEIVHGTKYPIPECPCERSLKTKSFETAEIKINKKCYKISSYPIINNNDEITSFTHTIKDITEQKIIEDKILKNEINLNKAQKITNTGSFTWNVVTGEVNWSDNLYNLYGITKDYFKRKIIFEDAFKFIHPDDLTKIHENIEQAKKGENLNNIEFRIIRPDGIVRILLAQLEITFNDKKEPVQITGTSQDITEQKKLESSLQESEIKYRDIVETSQNMIFRCNTEGRLIFINKSWAKEHGYTIDEIKNRYFTDFMAPEKAKQDLKIFKQILSGKSINNYVSEHLTKSGKTINLLFNAQPIIDLNGNVIGSQGTAINVTEKIQLTKYLNDSNEKFHSLVKSSSDAIISINNKKKIITWNPAAEKLFGYTKKEIINKNLKKIINDKSFNKNINKIIELNPNKNEHLGNIFESNASNKNGTIFPIEFSVSQWKKDNKIFLTLIIRDITEQKNYLSKLETEVIKRTTEIKKINMEISEKLQTKVMQINNISNMKEQLNRINDIDIKLELILNNVLSDLKMDTGVIVIKNNKEIETKKFISKNNTNLNNNFNLKKLLNMKCFNQITPVSEINDENKCILTDSSIHCSSILIKNKKSGILAIGNDKKKVLDEEDLSVLKLYADIVGTTLEIEKIVIEPQIESSIHKKRKYSLEKGEVYLVINDVNLSYSVFADNVLSGKSGLCISRIYPTKIREKHDLKSTPIVWLTDSVIKDQKTIFNLQDLSIMISKFIEVTDEPIILLDGIEYLISIHGFNSIIHFLQTKRSQIEANNGNMIVPIEQNAVDTKELTLIQRECLKFKMNVL